MSNPEGDISSINPEADQDGAGLSQEEKIWLSRNDYILLGQEVKERMEKRFHDQAKTPDEANREIARLTTLLTKITEDMDLQDYLILSRTRHTPSIQLRHAALSELTNEEVELLRSWVEVTKQAMSGE